MSVGELLVPSQSNNPALLCSHVRGTFRLHHPQPQGYYFCENDFRCVAVGVQQALAVPAAGYTTLLQGPNFIKKRTIVQVQAVFSSMVDIVAPAHSAVSLSS